MTSYAFFDVDGTILKFTSMTDFYRYAEARGCFTTSLTRSFCKALLKFGPRYIPRNTLNSIYYRQFAGCSVSEIEDAAEKWFNRMLQRDPSTTWNSAVLAQLRWHQSEKHHVVLVSGSFHACLAPIARHLDVADVLCANLKVHKGIYTGALLPPQTIGKGKAIAIREFLSTQPDVAHERIWAYGDHFSDLPMLQIATIPVVVSGDSKLEAHAQSSGWERI